jgi:uncharacterized protein (DUF1330 family)
MRKLRQAICDFCKKKFWHRKKKQKFCSNKCKGNKYMGENSGLWKGGRRKTERGYILIYKPEHPFCSKRRYVYEHRLVIEKQIGRYLLSTEPIHHLGNRDDNRPNVLMAFISDSVHNRFHKNPLTVKPKEIIFDGRKV